MKHWYTDLRGPGGPGASTAAKCYRLGTKELMYRLGHASQQAEPRYQHATSQRDRGIAEALDALIGDCDMR